MSHRAAAPEPEPLPPAGPPAGWYADPLQGDGQLRYWDGASWSERTAPGVSSLPAPVDGGVTPPAATPPSPVTVVDPVAASVGRVSPVMVTQVRPNKSRGVAVLLAVLFGPLGLLYWSVRWALILIVVSVLTLGIGWLIAWPAAIFIAALSQPDGAATAVSSVHHR